MGRKPKRPWGDLGKPIERFIRRDDERHGEAAQNDAFAEQYRKMCRLKKEQYGIEGETGWRPWYELALALALERDDGLKIIDPPPRRTDEKAAKWRGAEGLQFLDEIDAIREDMEAEVGHKVSDEAVLAEHQEACERYSKMKFETLKKNYYEAQRHHRKSTKLGAK
jgi:hypothetical protein